MQGTEATGHRLQSFRCPPSPLGVLTPPPSTALRRPLLTPVSPLVPPHFPQALVKAGADMEAKDKNGLTALQVGCRTVHMMQRRTLLCAV